MNKQLVNFRYEGAHAQRVYEVLHRFYGPTAFHNMVLDHSSQLNWIEVTMTLDDALALACRYAFFGIVHVKSIGATRHELVSIGHKDPSVFFALYVSPNFVARTREVLTAFTRVLRSGETPHI